MECLAMAMTGAKRYEEGVYGGLTAKERRVLKRERRAS
jgi:hypothetical protein